MSDIPTTIVDHCETRQLKELLTLAAGEDGSAGPLAAQLGSRRDLSRRLADLCEGPADAGEALLSAVCDIETPLAALQGLKDLAKTLSSKASTDQDRAAAAALYHAAVAAALVRYGQNISSRPASTRAGVYEELAVFLAGDMLGRVFRLAAERISDHTENSGSTSRSS